MIDVVDPRFRWFVTSFVAVLVAIVAPSHAIAADGEWFDPNRPPVAPQGSPAPMPNTPVPSDAGPPLAPSPLLEGEAPIDEANDRNPEALTKFRPHLDPYGTWIDDPTYGRVWIPHPNVVGPNFQPYVSNGRWALDESGEWIWVSDYSFGWVVFHYGRWVWVASASSWAWVPGNQYSPAWVTWRVPTGSDSYVGWAPAPPTFVWFGGFSVWWGYDPYYWWVFCPSPYLFHYHVGHYVVTDPYWQGHAARTTRPYVPASPHPHSGDRAAHARRSPSLSAARVPPSAVPAERIAARRPAPSSTTARPTLDSGGARRYSTRTDTPTRATFDSRPAPTHSFSNFKSREGRAPAMNTPRLAPVRSAPRMRAPDMRAAPRAVRPPSRR
jgi:hypothetical protein